MIDYKNTFLLVLVSYSQRYTLVYLVLSQFKLNKSKYQRIYHYIDFNYICLKKTINTVAKIVQIYKKNYSKMDFIQISLILFLAVNVICNSVAIPSTKEGREIDTLYNSAKSGASITCPFSETITCDSTKKYPSFDGSCNNLKNPYYGKNETPMKRLLSANYADGKDTPKTDLPNPRDISSDLQKDNDNLEPIWTHIYATFGQFLSHDLVETSMSSTDGTKPDCPCDSTSSVCYSISVKTDDILGSTCMKFVRSSGSFDIKCNATQREQLNLISSFIDGTMIYGHSKSTSDSLRTMTGGLLLTSDGISADKPYLPKDDTICSKASDPTMKCFKSGDSRTSENLGLTGIHAVFLREHNRIATELTKVNPNWDDQRLFQETRKIIIAIFQHITYSQYVPGTIGNEGSANYGILPTTDNTYFTGYNSNV